MSRSWDCQKVRPLGPYGTRAKILSSPLILRRWKLKPEREGTTPGS